MKVSERIKELMAVVDTLTDDKTYKGIILMIAKQIADDAADEMRQAQMDCYHRIRDAVGAIQNTKEVKNGNV